MATKTRAKTKRKKTTISKTARLRKTVRKPKAIRKEAAKKPPPRVAERIKAKPTAKVAVKPRPVSQRTQPETVKPPSSPLHRTAEEQRIGVVTHYYGHLSVVAIQLEPGTTLRLGDIIHIRGHTTDFTQKAESLEVNHAPVTEVGLADDFGLKVIEHAREHDIVCKVRS
jgi:putative protease